MNLGSPKRRVLRAVAALGPAATSPAVRRLAGKGAWRAIGFLLDHGYLRFRDGVLYAISIRHHDVRPLRGDGEVSRPRAL